MAEVIDESIRNMTSNMVTKADQEKVCIRVWTTTTTELTGGPYSINIPSKLTLHSLNQSCN